MTDSLDTSQFATLGLVAWHSSPFPQDSLCLKLPRACVSLEVHWSWCSFVQHFRLMHWHFPAKATLIRKYSTIWTSGLCLGLLMFQSLSYQLWMLVLVVWRQCGCNTRKNLRGFWFIIQQRLKFSDDKLCCHLKGICAVITSMKHCYHCLYGTKFWLGQMVHPYK